MRRVLMLVFALLLGGVVACASTGKVCVDWNASVTVDGERPSEDW